MTLGISMDVALAWILVRYDSAWILASLVFIVIDPFKCFNLSSSSACDIKRVKAPTHHFSEACQCWDAELRRRRPHLAEEPRSFHNTPHRPLDFRYFINQCCIPNKAPMATRPP
jgi:hypothetical protein